MEETKQCDKCKLVKSTNEFHKRTRKSGYIYVWKNCKDCEARRKQTPDYVEKANKRSKENYKQNREIILKRVKEYSLRNKECIKTYQDMYHKKEDVKIKRRARRKERRQSEPEFKIMHNISSRIRSALKNNKNKKSIKYLGCTIQQFKQWLEYQFDSNMNWSNQGTYWEIDHVTPCASFCLEDENEQMLCFNWKNCRPLESKKNIQKSDKILPFEILLQELRVFYYCKVIMQHIQIAGNSLAS